MMLKVQFFPESLNWEIENKLKSYIKCKARISKTLRGKHRQDTLI